MRIHLYDALPASVLPAIAAQVLTSEQTLGSGANTTAVAPSPLVIPPSQYCKWMRRRVAKSSPLMQYLGDGVDGLWSTFALRVGSPPQDVRGVVSTNSPQTLVVVPLGCTSNAINPVPNDCANGRGGLFNPNSSSTWLEQGLFGINENGVGFEANLGYSQPAEFGLDTLGLGFVAGGSAGPTLENQTIGGIATASPFYL
jgi:hypothetical protein